MSKQTKKAAARMGGRSTPPVGKTAIKKGVARVYAPPAKTSAPQGNPRALQIVAGILAALCLIGGVAIVLSDSFTASTTTIIELVALALIAAGALFVALQPARVLAWGSKIR